MRRIAVRAAAILLTLIATFGAQGHAPTTASAQTPATDRTALVALYNATDGPNWTNNTNWLSEMPLDAWHGVSTDSTGRFTGLSLPENELTGEIPSNLGALANLEAVDLSDNQLRGAIPPEMGRLANLKYLDLSRNQLGGAIPTELGRLTGLVVLWLGSSQLTGCIPAGLQDVEDHDLAELGLPLCETSEEEAEADLSAEATPGSVVQTAESRTGLPTVGVTQVADDGLTVTLDSVQRLEQLTQAHGSAFRSKNCLYLVVTTTFTNTNDSGNIVVSKDHIVLLEPDGNEIAVDEAGVNALIGMATPATDGRPLFLIEAVPGGRSTTIAVVFDISPGLVDLDIDIEGSLFEVPNP